MRPRWYWLGCGLGLVALAWGMFWAIETWRFRTVLDQAKQEMNQGLYEAAGVRLAQLSARWSGQGEVNYLLGVCETAAGRPNAALAAWAGVPPQSPFAVQAALQRGALEMKRGRLAAAEAILLAARPDSEPDALAIRRLLIPLLWIQGRYDEVLPLVEANWRLVSRPDWPQPDEAIEMLRMYIALHVETLAVEGVRTTLEHAATQAPHDDRVWLGRANLAIRTGQFEEAELWLDACQRRRPDDPAVWRARLDWALATEQSDRARQALAQLPADRFSPDQVFTLWAWFAARRGDADAERLAWRRVVEFDPGNVTALERLADLALQAGEARCAIQFRQRKAELDQAKHRYLTLFKDNDLVTHAPEMARLAETLGYRFETMAFQTMLIRWNSQDRAAVADRTGRERAEPPREAADPYLAALLDAELGSAPPRGSSPAEPRGARPHFLNQAQAAGLSFVFHNGGSEIRQLPETMSGGVALLDYDGDGWLDVYVVQGGPFPPDPSRPHDGDRLFRNRGDGTFEDVTEAAGLAAFARGYGHGVTVGDYDNDGWPDLFITRWRSYALYRNRGDGTFEDVTEAVGLGGDRDWPTSAAFADFDNDGDLDLYVCHYLVWDADHPQLCRSLPYEGYVTCDPRLFESLPDRLYRNEGGRFVEVTESAGIVAPDGRGLGVVAADLDGDGLVDLYVANDGTANFFYRNLGDLRFEERGHEAGLAGNAEGGYQAGMGIACGDLDGDGRIDLAVTNFEGEGTTFYHNLGYGFFADRTAAIGLAAPSRYRLGFGAAFLDVNNDGHLDLMTANGHVNDYRPKVQYAMRAQLLLGDREGRLTDVSKWAGPPFQTRHLGRGLAAGDLDNDGRIDVLVVAQNEPLVYFHNQTEGGHAVTLRLEGRASNRDGVGAQVTVRAGGHRQVAQRFGGGSYQSAGDPRLHFGLGERDRIEVIEVQWPSGQVDRYYNLPADTGFHLREGDPEPTHLDGFPMPSSWTGAPN